MVSSNTHARLRPSPSSIAQRREASKPEVSRLSRPVLKLGNRVGVAGRARVSEVGLPPEVVVLMKIALKEKGLSAGHIDHAIGLGHDIARESGGFGNRKFMAALERRVKLVERALRVKIGFSPDEFSGSNEDYEALAQHSANKELRLLVGLVHLKYALLNKA